MKTIRQVAEELDVSKQTIRNKIEELSLQKSLQKKGNQILLNDNQEKLIKNSLKKGSSKQKRQEKNEKINENFSPILIHFFQKEIEEKNNQIKMLQTALDQEQKLHSISQSKLSNLLIEMSNREEETKNEDNKRKSWWRHIFKD